MKKLLRFLGRLVRREDVIIVRQSKAQWEAQFNDGKWDRLEEGQPNTELLAKLIRKEKKNVPSLRVLDVGCGNGGLARLIAGDSGIAYTGIDISETAVTIARLAMPDGRFMAMDAENPSSDLDLFDRIVFNEVFFYIHPDRVLPRYRAHAAPDARVYISVVRSWRTPFVFHRIRRHLRIVETLCVAEGSLTWDVVVGHFL